jgi:hypothetical protein
MGRKKTNNTNHRSRFIVTGALAALLGFGVTCHDFLFGSSDVDNSSRFGQYNHPTEQVTEDDSEISMPDYSGINIPEVFANLPVADDSSNIIVGEEKISCNNNEDCDSGYCLDDFCTEGKLGEFCKGDIDCLEGTCQSTTSKNYSNTCKIPINEACESDDECKYSCVDDVCSSGKSCETDDDCVRGLCIDEFCKGLKWVCEEDSECLNGCGEFRCNDSSLDGYCEYSADCESDTAVCLNDICVEKLGEGNPCTDKDECLYACEVNKDTLQGTCTSGKSEDYCDSDFECISGKCASYGDAKRGLVKEDTCLKSAGESCEFDPECVFACDIEEGICTDGSNGDQCISDKECNEGFCIGGSCDSDISKRTIDEECGDDSHCTEGLFCNNEICDNGDLSLGEKCGDYRERRKCEEGLTCDSKECVPVLNEGDYCSTNLTSAINDYIARGYEGHFLEKGVCDEGVYCQRIEITLRDEGVCTSKKINSEQCSSNLQCQSGICLPNDDGFSYCSSEKANDGELCANYDDCETGLTCEIISKTEEGNIIKRCVPLGSKELNSPCKDNDSCQSERCSNPNLNSLGDKFCLPKLELGQLCKFSDDCISGKCRYVVNDGNSYCIE